MRASSCSCAADFQCRPAFSGDYRQLKAIFNRARHPTFIGRSLCASAVKTARFRFQFAGSDIATAIVNPRLNILLALAVVREHQGHGLGTAILRYLACNFARVESRAVPFFERNGFIAIGEPKKGKTLYTQIMVRASLIPLAGRLHGFTEQAKSESRDVVGRANQAVPG